MTAPSNKKPRIEPTSTDGSKPLQLQRRRVFRACVPCRKKKTKCSGTTPVCPQCQSTNTECSWIETKDRAALSRHYVQELEARLLYMEQLFKEHAPHVEVFPPEGSGLPPDFEKHMPDIVRTFASRAGDDAYQAKEEELDDIPLPREEEEPAPLTDHFGQMALDAEGHLRWIGGSSTMTLIETFRNETANLEDASPLSDSSPHSAVNVLYFPTGLGFGKLKALPYAEEVEYPERDLADLLVQSYFDRFHHLLPVIDKPSFLERYHHLMDRNGQGERAGFVAVVFAVFTCAARFVDDPRIKSEEGSDGRGTAMVFYERAMMLYYISATSTQLAHVQCFALLSSFLASLNRLAQAWLLVGQAVRTAQDLGLHRSPRALSLSPVEKETRRKVWWCVYGLDRMLAVQLGRPLGIDDMDIDVELPHPVDDDDLPTYLENKLPQQAEATMMQGFIALTRLYRIAGKVLRHVYSLDKLRDTVDESKLKELQVVVDRLDTQLNKWCNDLHPNFRQNATDPQMFSMSAVLCTSYYAVLITLHRSFLPSRRNPASSSLGSNSVPKAVAASRSCIFIATTMGPAIPPSHHLAIFVQYLFSSAVIILLVVMHATDKTASNIAMEEVENCRRALESLEGLWPGAKKCKELLKDLTQTTRENIAKGGTAVKAFAAAAAVHTASSVPPEIANSVGPSNRGFHVSPTPTNASRSSLSPPRNNGFTFGSPAPGGHGQVTPSPPPPPQQPQSGSGKRRREEEGSEYTVRGLVHSRNLSIQSASSPPLQPPPVSNTPSIQGIAISNVSGGHFQTLLNQQPSSYPVSPTRAPMGWSSQPSPHLPPDSAFRYPSPPQPGAAGHSGLYAAGGIPHLHFAGVDMGAIDLGASSSYDITAFSGMDFIQNFDGSGLMAGALDEQMEMWGTLPNDAFNVDPSTPFGRTE